MSKKKVTNKNSFFSKISTKNKVLVIVSSIMICLSLLSIGAIALLNTRLFEEKPQGGGESIDESRETTPDEIKEKSVNFLVVGLDESENLTDVMMVVNFDIAEKKISVLQIPRDSYIGTDYPTGKINSVYGHPKKGQSKIGSLIKIINDKFKLPIDHYVTITLEGFRNAVDAMGGVNIDLPQAIYYLPGKTLPKGPQKLDGEKAEWFIRYRKGYLTGDIGRMGAQKLFLEALVNDVKSMGISSALKVVNKVYSQVTTDLTLGDMLKFAKVAMTIDTSNIYMGIVPGEGTMHNGYSVFSIYRDEFAKLLNENFRPYMPSIPEEELEIEEVHKKAPPSSSRPSGNNNTSSSNSTSSSGNSWVSSSKPPKPPASSNVNSRPDENESSSSKPDNNQNDSSSSEPSNTSSNTTDETNQNSSSSQSTGNN